MPETIIRPYQRRDRESVRRISGDTANLGKPLETFFRDREIMVDVLMDYYLDYEPASCWVAEHEGKVVGYLCGC
ncbi:MAG TPA: GNAT family acetyltransferase, partial [Candidatus Omnitrophota bacterium]|nr:GNAT family acetyltransferase [Candidatus Omnitrophota bacterium]